MRGQELTGVEPALTLQIALNQVTSIAQGYAQSNPYYLNFATKVAAIGALSSADRQGLDARALEAVTDVVIPAYEDLRSELQNLLNNAPRVIGSTSTPDHALPPPDLRDHAC